MSTLEELLCGKAYGESKKSDKNIHDEVRRLEELASIVESQSKASAFSFTKKVSQAQKIRSDQVKNNAGGYVFEVDDLSRIRRFLLLGTAGGTYYSSEKELTMDNAKALCEIIGRGRGPMLLREIIDVSLSGRSPKQDPVIFALALCARYKVCDTLRKKSENKTAQRDRREESMAGEHLSVQKEINETEEVKKIKRSDEESKNALGCESEEEMLSNTYFEYQRELQKIAFRAVAKVCRIPTHLFMFLKFCKKISSETGAKPNSSGWGRAMRITIADWYFSQKPERLAMQVTKYRSRENYSHRDVLKLCHLHPKSNFPTTHNYWAHHLEYDYIFNYIRGEKKTLKRKAKEDSTTLEAKKASLADEKSEGHEKRVTIDLEKLRLKEQKIRSFCSKKSPDAPSLGCSKAVQLIDAFETAQLISDPAIAANLIKEYGLVREHIPSELLNSRRVWSALIEDMPMTAMIRNLGKMSSVGLLNNDKENSSYVEMVASRLTDENALHEARIHPVSLLLAASVYNSGYGARGGLHWTPVLRISGALEKAFLLAFKNVTATNKRYCLAIDVSESMQGSVMDSVLSCKRAAAALSMVFLRTEPQVEVVAFSTKITKLNLKKSLTLQEIENEIAKVKVGPTDCAQPIIWANKMRKQFDVFIVYTDNETWVGEVHPFMALQRYRARMGVPDARFVVMAMTATDFTIADPNDAGMLDICGFDSSVPELLRDFVLGKI